MKLYAVGSVALTLATCMLGGCGPGLTSRTRAPTDVFKAMDAELANAIGTTSLTSADAPSMDNRHDRRLPEGRMPVSAAKHEDDSPPPVQTWGSSQPSDEDISEYGF
jgi:hypothetical protein